MKSSSHCLSHCCLETKSWWKLLSWCKNNWGFALLKFTIWYWDTFSSVVILYIIVMYIYIILWLFASYYLLFIFILDYITNVSCIYIYIYKQKVNSRDFFIQVQMSHKAAEITHKISSAFDPTANKCTVKWWFKFCKGDECLEDDKHSGQTSKVDSNHLRGSLKLILL